MSVFAGKVVHCCVGASLYSVGPQVPSGCLQFLGMLCMQVVCCVFVLRGAEVLASFGSVMLVGGVEALYIFRTEISDYPLITES